MTCANSIYKPYFEDKQIMFNMYIEQQQSTGVRRGRDDDGG